MKYQFDGTVSVTAGELTPGGGGGGSGGAPVINVKNAPYNAKGDGITDDTAAIQAAINAVPTTGGTVFVPDGIYLLTVNNPYVPNADGSLRLKSNMTFRMSKNATLKAQTNALNNYDILRVLGLSNVNIEGGILQGERFSHTGPESGQAGMGIWMSNSTDIRITGVTLKEFWGDGIYVGNAPVSGNNKNIYVTDSLFLDNRRQGISISAVDRMTVDNCIFQNTQGTDPASGIDVEPELGGTVTNLTITGSIFTGNKIGIQALGMASASIMGNTFSDNTTYGIYIGTAAYYTIIGNTVSRSGSQGIYLNFATDCIVSDNIVHDSGSHGIYLLNGCFRNAITGNRVDKNNGFGILLYNAHNNSITSNHCTGNLNSGISTQNSNYTNVADNYTATNTQTGVYLFSGKMNTATGNIACQNGAFGVRISDCTDFSVTDNFCMENSQALNIESDNILVSGTCNNGRVTGNICRKGTTTNLPRYGVRIDSATVSNTLFMNNDLRGGGQTADSSDLGTQTVLPAGSTSVNVKDYGAAGDGTTDDTAAIQAAITFVQLDANAPGEVFLPVGTYKITANISYDPVKVTLRGNGATINASTMTSNSVLTLYSANSVNTREHIMKIEGLRFVGPGGASNVTAITSGSDNANAASRVTIRNVSFTGFMRALNVGNNSYGHNIENCEFNDLGFGIFVPNTVTGSGERISFRGCRFTNCPLAVYAELPDSEMMFSQCTFMNNTKHMTLSAGVRMYMNECHIEGDSPASAGASMFTLTGEGTTLSISQSRIVGRSSGAPVGTYAYFSVDPSVIYGGLSIYDCFVGNIPTNRLAVGTGYIDIQRIKTGAAGAPFVPADRMGFLGDPSFEGTTPLNQFTVTQSGTGTVTVDSTVANTGGTKSIKLTKPAAADTAEITFTVPIAHGERAFVDLAYKWNNVVQGTVNWESFFLRYEYQDNNGVLIGTANEIYRIGTQATFVVYQLVSFQTVVPPPGARRIRFRIGIVGGATGTAWIDDLTINVC